MIIVASPNKPFEYTAKFTARRQAIIAAYELEIEALYATVDETTQADITPPSSWSKEHTVNFVRTAVNKVLKSPAADTEDIFQQGCDRYVQSPDTALTRHSNILVVQLTSNLDTQLADSCPQAIHQSRRQVYLLRFCISTSDDRQSGRGRLSSRDCHIFTYRCRQGIKGLCHAISCHEILCRLS